MCYHVEFGRPRLSAETEGNHQKGAMEPRPLAMGAWLTPRNMPLSTRVALPNLVVLGQTVRALLRRSHLKNLIPSVPPFMVTLGYRNTGWSTASSAFTHSVRHAVKVMRVKYS